MIVLLVSCSVATVSGALLGSFDRNELRELDAGVPIGQNGRWPIVGIAHYGLCAIIPNRGF